VARRAPALGGHRSSQRAPGGLPGLQRGRGLRVDVPRAGVPQRRRPQGAPVTLLDTRPPEPESPAPAEAAPPDVPPAPPHPGPVEGETSTLLTGIATFLAVAAAGWMAAGVFRGALPRAVGVAGAL